MDCSRFRDPQMGVIDRLARLVLALRRQGCEPRLVNVSDRLLELVALAGLEGVLAVEPGGQSEQREQAGGVEEERELDDATR